MGLNAYIDDSGGTDQNDLPYFVLGGLVSSAGHWSQFTQDWLNVLSIEPAVEYFKMSEANSLRGQFSRGLGWDTASRDERVRMLVEVIRSYPMFRVSASINKALFYELIAPLKPTRYRPTAGDPYYLAFNHLVVQLPMLQAYNLGQVPEDIRIDFIFDQQGKAGRRANKAWAYVKEVVLPNMNWEGIPDVSPYLGAPPVYRNSKIDIPLQAADLYVWHIRKRLENDRNLIVQPLTNLKILQQIPGYDIVFNRREMLNLRDGIAALFRDMGHSLA